MLLRKKRAMLSPPKQSASSRQKTRSFASASKSPNRSISAGESVGRKSRDPSRHGKTDPKRRSKSPHNRLFEENPDLHPAVLYESVRDQNERRMRDKCDQLFYHDSKDAYIPERNSPQNDNQPQQTIESREFYSPEEPDGFFEIQEARSQEPTDEKQPPKSNGKSEEDKETLGLLAKIKQQSKLKQQNGHAQSQHQREDSKNSNRSAKSGRFKEIFQHLYLSRDEFSTSQQA